MHEDSARERVPKIYRSEYTLEPFRSCLVCDRALEGASLHVVEKVMRQGEAVLEMALCDRCAEALVREFSEESREVLTRIQLEWIAGADPRAERCAGCRKPRDHAGSFVIGGTFLSGFVLVREIAVCGACEEAVEPRLSRKTREAYGRFVETHFPGVPDYVDLPLLVS